MTSLWYATRTDLSAQHDRILAKFSLHVDSSAIASSNKCKRSLLVEDFLSYLTLT
ncbi:hypothetical protein [Trichocoleus sp. DQ-U1]|uniref:hypothetical protein n=1 Tax=Trichocoleus sp. DQ-U1 TaxID=2933926 RepID=UPI00329A39CE